VSNALPRRVPQGERQTAQYIDTALAWRNAGSALRVCLHTDARNERSAAAIARIGGKFEGILRAHRLAADYTARDSMRFSILADEWPAVRRRLNQLTARR
jgi:RimJ/RimL family protein N-acetyltransferase